VHQLQPSTRKAPLAFALLALIELARLDDAPVMMLMMRSGP
jgi:hypothetical protein